MYNLPRKKKGWMKLQVVKVVEEVEDTRTLFLEDYEDGGRVIDYIPGQYLTFRFDDLSERPIVRSYSLSSCPRETDYLTITVKQVVDPVVSKYLCCEVKEGDVLTARGPIGRFVYESQKDTSHLVLVCAGSGITPFFSMLKEFEESLGSSDSPQEITLIAVFKTREDIIFRKKLEDLGKRQRINITIALTREDLRSEGYLYGRITGEMVEEVFKSDLGGKTYMVCGPGPMMESIKAFLLSRGVGRDCIKEESFDS